MKWVQEAQEKNIPVLISSALPEENITLYKNVLNLHKSEHTTA